ncbi:MAG: divergent PAP2 family protein [Clostridiales bacterium]|nr:divergent PAP2 family protein [Clostridiales bacterium]
MTFVEGLINNEFFKVAFIAWFIAQFFKVILTLLIEKKLDIGRFWGSGGMPSSHTSSVVGVSTAIGLVNGFGSAMYALSLVFAFVVMYDASGVRRAVGKQAAILNNMIHDLSEHKHIEQEQLKELIGHTPFEVIGGAILGIIVANIYL